MHIFSFLGKNAPALLLTTLAFGQPSLQIPAYTAPDFSTATFSPETPTFTRSVFLTPASGLEKPTFTRPVFLTPASGLEKPTFTVSGLPSLQGPTQVATGPSPLQTGTSGSDLSTELQSIIKSIESLLGLLTGAISSTDIISLLKAIISQLLGLVSTHASKPKISDPSVVTEIISLLETLVGVVGSLLSGLTQLLKLGVFQPSQHDLLGGLVNELLQAVLGVVGLVTHLVPGLTNLVQTVESDLSGLVGGLLGIL